MGSGGDGSAPNPYPSRGGTIMIDGVPVPSNIGSSMGTALNTIFTWEQIFNAVMKHYKQENE